MPIAFTAPAAADGLSGAVPNTKRGYNEWGFFIKRTVTRLGQDIVTAREKDEEDRSYLLTYVASVIG